MTKYFRRTWHLLQGLAVFAAILAATYASAAPLPQGPLHKAPLQLSADRAVQRPDAAYQVAQQQPSERQLQAEERRRQQLLAREEAKQKATERQQQRELARDTVRQQAE